MLSGCLCGFQNLIDGGLVDQDLTFIPESERFLRTDGGNSDHEEPHDAAKTRSMLNSQ